MSKLHDIFNGMRAQVASMGGAWKATTKAQPMDKMPYRAVLLVADQLTREPAGSGLQRYKLDVVIFVRSKTDSETDEEVGTGTMLDDSFTAYETLSRSEKFEPGGTAVVDQVTRGPMQFWVWPSGDAGRAAGGAFRLTFEWRE